MRGHQQGEMKVTYVTTHVIHKEERASTRGDAGRIERGVPASFISKQLPLCAVDYIAVCYIAVCYIAVCALQFTLRTVGTPEIELLAT